MIRAWFFVFAFFGISGCANTAANVLKASTTTAIAAAGCYQMIDSLDQTEQVKIRYKAKADPAGAKHDLEAWLPKYDAIFKTCQAAHLGASAALSALPSIEAGIAGDKKHADWIGILVKLSTDVYNALDTVGLKLGPPTPAPAGPPPAAPVPVPSTAQPQPVPGGTS